jgi:hypothetical protein
MLASIISTSVISSSVISPSVSMLNAPRLPEFGPIVIIGLILLLSFKEVLSRSNLYEKSLESSLNIGIAPLMISFTAIVVYKIVEIFVT